jgi:hypothetical protein
MRVVKIIGVVVGVLLIMIIGPVLIGIIAQSPIAMFLLIGLGFAILLIMWWSRLSSSPRRSWFFRSRDRGATQARDRSLDATSDK